jgi:hypothetical protein
MNERDIKEKLIDRKKERTTSTSISWLLLLSLQLNFFDSFIKVRERDQNRKKVL